MKRLLVLCALFAASCVTAPVVPQQPPQPPAPDRTAEFRATCSVIWQEELGRAIDAPALEDCVAQAKAGRTGDEQRQLVHDGDEAVAWRNRPQHLDPATYSDEQLLKFRGALFTVKANHLAPATGFCDLPAGPRPHQPDNIAVFAAYYYTPEQRQCVYQLWKERGYTHGPIGPFIDPGYHGQTPPIDLRADGGAAVADLMQEVYDAGLIPVVFITPDGWTVEQLRTLEPILRSERWQHLVRVVVNGYEQQGSKYGWSNAQYVAYLSWLRDVFPNAKRGLHTIADIEAPVGNGDDTSRPGMSNGECWGRVTPLIHFWLHQSAALFTPNHMADNGQTDGANWLALWDKTNPYSFISRFGRGVAGWPTSSANGGPLCVTPGEYASFITWWQNQAEDVARDWGAKALAAGSCGFMDGGRE